MNFVIWRENTVQLTAVFTTILYVTANVLTHLLSFCRLEKRYRNGVGIKAVRYWHCQVEERIEVQWVYPLWQRIMPDGVSQPPRHGSTSSKMCRARKWRRKYLCILFTVCNCTITRCNFVVYFIFYKHVSFCTTSVSIFPNLKVVASGCLFKVASFYYCVKQLDW